MRIAPAALLAATILALPAAADAQTCRTSQSLGTIICDNGANARTSSVTGVTTLSDGRTALTNPVAGTTRYSDGVLLEMRPPAHAVPPVPPVVTVQTTDRSVEAVAAPVAEPKPAHRKARRGRDR